MSGLTYNGKTESGEARWDALKNCKLTIHETTITLQVSNDLNRHLFIYLPHLPWNIFYINDDSQITVVYHAPAMVMVKRRCLKAWDIML